MLASDPFRLGDSEQRRPGREEPSSWIHEMRILPRFAPSGRWVTKLVLRRVARKRYPRWPRIPTNYHIRLLRHSVSQQGFV